MKDVLLEIMEQGNILSRELMNIVFTQFERDEHDKLLHGNMDTYTGCLPIPDKTKFIALLDADMEKLKAKLEKAK